MAEPALRFPIPDRWPDLPRAWGGAVAEGDLRTLPEDFRVTEVPLLEPQGEGEHCWLYVRKRNANTPWVARRLARFAGVATGAVSYAGLKDRHAVTEQWFSVQLPGRADPDWGALQEADFRVLEARRHTRKLRTGTLRGNRFEVRIRGVHAEPEIVEQRLRAIAQGGFPNYFGSQRFGRDGANLAGAEQLFRGRRVARQQRGIYLSAARSALFNQLLAARVRDASWECARVGEALQLEGRSACFVAGEVDDALRQRLAALEVHPTGPLCGAGEPLPRQEAARYEQEQLQPFADWIDALQRLRVQAARRALRVRVQDLQWRLEEDGHWLLSFFLPAGSYATSLLRELFELRDRARAS